MRTRAEAVELIFVQLDDYRHRTPLDKADHHHYGRQELRELMDFIYEEPPKGEAEEVRCAS